MKDENLFKGIAVAFLGGLVFGFTFGIIIGVLLPPTSPVEQTTTAPKERTDWEVFVDALVWVESHGQTDARSCKNARGVLQITPITVAEVNRLLKEEKYTHDDAYDSLKSFEMFEVIQRQHNPTKSIERAILLHNPKAGRWYANRIYETMGIIRYCESKNNSDKFAGVK